MVRPDKGDAGEIFVSLYMLYCGDRLRKLLNMGVKQQSGNQPPYSHFSVSLDAWLNLMLSGGKLPDGNNPDPLNKDCKASVGFIQVCRNPLRLYNRSWKLLKNQRYLKHIYESGIGFFTCNNGQTIDFTDAASTKFWKTWNERLERDKMQRAFVCLSCLGRMRAQSLSRGTLLHIRLLRTC